MAVIIYPPTLDWDFMTQRPQHLMKQFALDGHEVYFCNKTQSNKELITEILPNLSVVKNHQYFIDHVIPRIKKRETKILVWVSWAKLHDEIDQYLPDHVIFDFLDDFPEWSEYTASMVNRSDTVFVTSERIKQYMNQHFPKKVTYQVQNGCELSHFQQFKKTSPKKPVELQHCRGPIIGYVGAWASWVDQDLVKHVANSFPGATIVIIGPQFGALVDRTIPNLLYLGKKNYEVLPQYLYYCDVCFVPFKINQITMATNPIKMYEYLASGKPVVTTDIPEAREIPNVYIGKDYETFINHIHNLLSPSYSLNHHELYQWLSLQTWEYRYQIIKDVFHSKQLY